MKNEQKFYIGFLWGSRFMNKKENKESEKTNNNEANSYNIQERENLTSRYLSEVLFMTI